MERGSHTELMQLKGAYYALVQTQEEGQEEGQAEKDKAEADQENNQVFMEEESSWKKPDDSARISFMVPTDKMRSLTKADKSTRSEARLSRYGYKLLLSIYQ